MDEKRKPSTLRRFFRSYFGRIVLALILIAVIQLYGIWATIVFPHLREKRIAQRIESLGGTVEWEDRGPVWIPEPICDRIRVFWTITKIEINDLTTPPELFSEFGALHSLRHLQLLRGQQITDTELKHLKRLTNLQSLILDETRITDAGLVHLNGLTKLEFLSLDDTRITDAGLMHLRGLTKLQFLSLWNAQITDTGLAHLNGMNNLEILVLKGARVSGNGLEHLKALVNLRDLDLRCTHVTDAGLEHLTSLTNLKTLDLNHTETTPEGRAILRKALPDCRIEPNDLPIPLNSTLPAQMEPRKMPGIPLESGIYKVSDHPVSSVSPAKQAEPSEFEIEVPKPTD